MPISLVRTLRREFRLEGKLTPTSFEFLLARPSLAFAATVDFTVSIEPQSNGFIKSTLPSGQQFEGLELVFVGLLDRAIVNEALRDEGDSPALFSAIVRLNGKRLAVICEDGPIRSAFAIALLAQGAEFEGDGFAFLSSRGLASFPLKPRLPKTVFSERFLPTAAMEAARAIMLSKDDALFAIDPTFNGRPWRPVDGPVGSFLFLDYNAGGQTNFSPINFQTALRRTMKALRFSQRPTISKFAAIQAVLEGRPSYRLSVGNIHEAASIVGDRLRQNA